MILIFLGPKTYRPNNASFIQTSLRVLIKLSKYVENVITRKILTEINGFKVIGENTFSEKNCKYSTQRNIRENLVFHFEPSITKIEIRLKLDL